MKTLSCSILLLFLLAGAVQAQATRIPLTPAEKRGKAFYLRGESASGQEITALMGDVDVPASTLT